MSNGTEANGRVPAWWRTLAIATATVMLAGLGPLILMIQLTAATNSRFEQSEERVRSLETQMLENNRSISINTGRLSRIEAQLDRTGP
jgi:hypothetical protein